MGQRSGVTGGYARFAHSFLLGCVVVSPLAALPQISGWHPNLIQLEAKAKEVCSVLLFVIDSKTRAIASMLEATEYIMSQRRVVIVILDIPEGGKIDGEPIGGRQLKDLNRARAFLCDIAARHQKYCDVFDSVENVRRHASTGARALPAHAACVC